MKLKWIQVVLGIAAIALVAGSFMHFFENELGKYFFGIGAVVLILNQLIFLLSEKTADFRRQRVLRLNLMVSMILALATWSMFDNTTLWIPAVLIYALVTLFLSFRS